MAEDLSLEKIKISGATLASLIQRVSSSPDDVDGLLFGQIHRIVSSNLTDDSPAAASSSSGDQIIATVTSFICAGKTPSFYDPMGRVNRRQIDYLLAHTPDCLIGWFSSRRETANPPSVRDLAVASFLSSQFRLRIEDSENPNSMNLASSSVFFLLTTPLKDQSIHTHQYGAYQFRSSNQLFEPRSIDIVNIGQAFRGHYGSFSPKSRFPLMMCELRSSAMSVDYDEGSLSAKKQAEKDQKEIDALADGLHVRNLRRLVGAEAANYTGGIEDMYNKMLHKVESLVSDVQQSSARVYEQDGNGQCGKLLKNKNEDQVIADVCEDGKEQTESAAQKSKGDEELVLNIMKSDSIHAPILDVEELIVRIQWIKSMLCPDVGEGSKSHWKYEDYCPSST